MSRRYTREILFKILYQVDITKFTYAEAKENILVGKPLKTTEEIFLNDVLKIIDDRHNSAYVDSLISKFSTGWSMQRISKVDLAILRVALFEILYCEDIPPSVSINEAVELSKKYSGEYAGKYINGVLGSINRHLVETTPG